MKTAATILAVLLAAVPDILAAGVHTGETGGGPRATRQLPATLDQYYPPVAGQPVYLFGMLSLETFFSGIVVDLMEDDMAGAQGSFGDFRRTYEEVAAMVPEWKGAFQSEKVGELGAALAAKDKAKAMDAFAAVGGICHRCHLATMVPVQQKFRWGTMSAITVKDPPSGAATPYAQFKSSLAANLAGITVDLRQGQTDNARKQFEQFRARFRVLSDSCRRCHDGKSRFYVDGDVQDAVDMIGRAFASRAPDPETVTSLVRKIGSESCSKCHLVHVPAALAGTSPR